MENNKDIRFWLPINIQKAVDEKGVEIMRLGGIASTNDEDSDGEFLDPSGFDTKPLIKSGIVNWHHQAKGQPKTIIGEPSKAEIRKDGLYIETDLYPSSQVARDVYELAQTLEKDSKTRRLGYSIEGKVLKRKSNDPKSPDFKIITKATITGVAITHQPKNPKTFANIIKGNVDETEDEYDEEFEKEMNTENAAALKPESVDKDLKVSLSKSQVMDRLFLDVPNLSIEKGEKIYQLITKIASMKNSKIISDEDIEKAYETLGLNNIEKAEETVEKAEEATSKEAEEADGDKGKKETKKEVAAAEASSDDNSVEKAEEVEVLGEDKLGERLGSIEKAIQDSANNTTAFIKAVGVLVKETHNALQKAETRENELLDIIKAQDETLSGLHQAFEEFGASVPPAKSLRHSNVVERKFDKAMDGHGDDNIEKAGENTLSIKRQKTTIVNLLDKATFDKGYDAEFSKACTTFEASGQLPESVKQRIQANYGITIVQ